MPRRMTQVKVDEFSVVRGSDKQPANPGARVLAYKAESKEEESGMEKPELTAVQKQSLLGTLTNSVRKALGLEEEAKKEEAKPTEAAKKEEEKKAEPAAKAEAKTEKAEPVLAAEIAKGIAPLIEVVEKFDSRLAKLEGASTGSKVLKASSAFVQDGGHQAKFPEFTKQLSDQLRLSPGQKLTKAVITTSGWSAGIAAVEAGQFIDYIVDESRVMKVCRTVQMPQVAMKIDKIGLGSKVLKKGTAGVDPGDTVSISGPTQVTLTAKEVVAIVAISDDVLEDNIEGDAFIQHLLRMISNSVANELEEAAIMGDTAVADTFILDQVDGWYKRAKAGGVVIEGMTDTPARTWPGTKAAKMTKLLKALPTKYRTPQMRVLMHPNLNLDYQDELAGTSSSEAFLALKGAGEMTIRNVPIVEAPGISITQAFTYSSTNYTDGTFVMLTDPRNLIVGIHREMRIEADRKPRTRSTEFVVTMRWDVSMENPAAVALYDHAKVA